ncbi:MAG: type II restriction endonuclease [Limisphaerales bacterium]
MKGFIDIYKTIFTISSDTKIVSKVLEIHLFPKILEFAEENGYRIVLTSHQNYYPDISFVKAADERIKFAVDLKTTYRDPGFPGHVNCFTLGSHGAYFRERTEAKNIQFPYADYIGHFCLGIIYTRADSEKIEETKVMTADEIADETTPKEAVGHRRVLRVTELKSITSVIKDFQFFACEKWELASDHQGSGNTANIGSITWIEDILKCDGVFARLGEDWFDEYWMNYKVATMMKKGKAVPITKLRDYIEFKKGDASLINPIKTKTKSKTR